MPANFKRFALSKTKYNTLHGYLPGSGQGKNGVLVMQYLFRGNTLDPELVAYVMLPGHRSINEANMYQYRQFLDATGTPVPIPGNIILGNVQIDIKELEALKDEVNSPANRENYNYFLFTPVEVKIPGDDHTYVKYEVQIDIPGLIAGTPRNLNPSPPATAI